MTKPFETGVAPARGLWLAVVLFGALLNPLMLAGPLFMLQVYDRVLPAGSGPTLLVLFALVAFVYAVMAVLDAARARLMLRIGGRLQAGLEGTVMAARARALARDPPDPRAHQALDDLDTVQRALASPALLALFDTPWAFLFLALLFLFHPAMGALALAAGVILVVLGVWGRWRRRTWQARANDAGHSTQSLTRALTDEAQMIAALGMGPALRTEWGRRRARAQEASLAVADRQAFDAASGRAFRLFMQSAILALGGLLVLRGQLSPGLIVAATILLGRALAPVEQVSAQWERLRAAHTGWLRLQGFLAAFGSTPAPRATQRAAQGASQNGALSVLGLVVALPGSGPLLRLDRLVIDPGQALGVIGPSGAGKSVLARALLGVIPLAAGKVQHGSAGGSQAVVNAGYLPQRPVLFDGTIAQNIARFDPTATQAAIESAARLAGLTDHVSRLSAGYETVVDRTSVSLPQGVIQRIGLARAYFADPPLVVLDEPNAHLDADGMAALNAAIRALKARGSVVVVLAHRPAGIAECDELLVLDSGAQVAYGPRDQVLQAVVRNHMALVTPQPQEAGR